MAPVSRSRLDRLIEKALTLDRPPIAGDWVRIGAQDDRQSLEPEGLTFRSIWFPYLPASGVAQVTGGKHPNLEVEFWLRPMRVTRRNGVYRPLNLLGRLLARERIGLWLMERAIARGNPPADDPACPQARGRLGLLKRREARVRGGLRIVRAFGGRWPNWIEFRIWLMARRLARALFAYPEIPTEGLHGVLIDRCQAILRFTYHGKERVFRLDQVRRHHNDKIHLLGRLLPSGEPRTFTLGMNIFDIEGFGTVGTGELWVELLALTNTAAGHHRIWINWCRKHDFPLPPDPDLFDRMVERLRSSGADLLNRRRQKALEVITAESLERRSFRLRRWWLERKFALRLLRHKHAWRLRDWWGLPRPKQDLRSKSARWRGFISQLADRVEAGETVDPRLLLSLDKLRNDPILARRLLRAMLRNELSGMPTDDPRRAWIERALALSPDNRQWLPARERRAADDLRLELLDDLPAGPTRWNRIRRGGRDPVLLMVRSVVCAIYAPESRSHEALDFTTTQRPLKTPFLAALFLSVAEWNGENWTLTPRSAPKLRWLAGLECEEHWFHRVVSALSRGKKSPAVNSAQP